MKKDYLDEMMRAFYKEFGGSTKEELANFKRLPEGKKLLFLQEKLEMKSPDEKLDFMRKVMKPAASVEQGKILRRLARTDAAFTWGFPNYKPTLVLPSEKALLQAYPFVSDRALVTALTLGFNKFVNHRREKEFEEQDRKNLATTGTTAALRIAQDKSLQKRDADRLEKYKRRLVQELG
ncbi:MAG: hypothetical protein K8R48_01630 [Alphaproteobacteria bacterium]|nr:hypothetical protein [Alphaproteobacteria bacterium]